MSSKTPDILPRTKYKLVFLGDESVGKTSIITRFMYEHFDDTYQATIGIDFLSKTLYLEDRVVRLQLWDTAGQERFRSLIPSYIRDSSVAIVCYSIDNLQSFNNVKKWIEEVRGERGDDVLIMLCGNKCDLHDREVAESDGHDLADQLGVLFMETSAKSGKNVARLFDRIASNLPASDEPKDNRESVINDVGYSGQNKGKCCG